MKLSQFKFKLPEEQIALYPHSEEKVVKTGRKKTVFTTKRRDECRLMILHKKSQTVQLYQQDDKGKDILDEKGNPIQLVFKDILNYFD